jgi:hypothetical protein
MRDLFVRAAAAACLCLLASTANAIPVNWDIDPSLSSFKLTIPDQVVTLGTTTATMRLRNQNNAAWTQNTAPVDGLLATNVAGGLSSIQFLGGASSLVGINTGGYRPNPAAFSTAATSTLNTAGSFTNTSTAQAVYGARVNAQVSIITVNTGYIAFDQVSYDVSSAVTAITGTSFLSNALSVGILDSRVGFDGISTIIGQVVADGLGQTGPISAVNTNGAAGSLVDLGGGNYRITIPINMPVFVDLSGVQLNATATGTLVGFANIPLAEPATIGLVAMGLVGMALRARRHRE